MEDNKIEEKYMSLKSEYQDLRSKYTTQVNLTGESSEAARLLLDETLAKKDELDAVKVKYDESKMDDNVIYLYLVPDLTKRMSSFDNYFTCSLSRFKLTDDEKTGILNLIDDSGQKVITVENRIVDPIYVKFAINVFIQMWSNYNFNSVRSSIISAVSDYIINTKRRDRIPVSDLVRVIESVDGVDSVSVYFDADKNNQNYFGDGNYGIGEYGDIVLSRSLTDKIGNKIDVNDIQAMFRGGFTSYNGVYYEDSLDAVLGPINITLRGKSNPNDTK